MTDFDIDRSVCAATIDLGALMGCMRGDVAPCGHHRTRDGEHDTDLQALDGQHATVTWSTDELCRGCPDHPHDDEGAP